MKCKHLLWQCYSWNGTGWDEEPFLSRREADAVLCESCGHWLPLGPANDSGPHAEAVKVERRAAELNAPGYSCADDSWMEWVGRRHYIEGHEFPVSFGGQCGWLAQVINDHTTTTAGTE